MVPDVRNKTLEVYTAVRFGGLAIFIIATLVVIVWALIAIYLDPTFNKTPYMPRRNLVE